jgi:hypothetical protein
MNQLIRIIGQAPSEVSPLVLLERIRQERSRVVLSLESFKAMPIKIKEPKKAKENKVSVKVSANIITMCKQYNMTIDEFLELYKESKGE